MKRIPRRIFTAEINREAIQLVTKQGYPEVTNTILMCSTITSGVMQKLAIKHQPISLSSFTPTGKWRNNPSDLPVH